VWPEIASHEEVKGANLALPCGGVHDAVHADGEYFCLPRQKLFPLHLIRNHLLRTDRLPVHWVKSQHQILLAPALREAELFLHTTDQDRNFEIGSHVARLQQRRSPRFLTSS